MELSQPLGAERKTAGRKATHDFLSLYSSSTAQQDPTPSPSQGNNYLKTHDFLQPLERIEKDHTIEKRATQATTTTPPSSAGHVLTHSGGGGGGGMVTSYPNQIRPLKQDYGTNLFAAASQTSGHKNTVRANENSNSSGYMKSSTTFSIWDESAVMKKGKTGKENVVEAAGLNWSSSSSLHTHNAAMFGGSSSSSQPQRNHNSFIDMITSAKNDNEDEDEDEDDEFVIKKEPTSHSKGSVSVKVEAKTMDQKPNTPRSKHSATEQRRRSKINDRFQKLREIIPNSDQKRDKASFLWEVIEYVQFLQEKVNKYEGSYNAWSHENSKMMMQQWRNGHNAEGFDDCSRGLNNISSYAVTEDKKMADRVNIQTNGKKLVSSSDASTSLTALKEKDQQQQPQASNNRDKTTTWPLLSPFQQQEPTVESGTINISSVYSQGLLNTLTKALQSSGVDLSQARISVQIDLGKRLVGISNSETYDNTKDGDVVTVNSSKKSKGAKSIADEEFGQALKRLKTSLSN